MPAIGALFEVFAIEAAMAGRAPRVYLRAVGSNVVMVMELRYAYTLPLGQMGGTPSASASSGSEAETDSGFFPASADV